MVASHVVVAHFKGDDSTILTQEFQYIFIVIDKFYFWQA